MQECERRECVNAGLLLEWSEVLRQNSLPHSLHVLRKGWKLPFIRKEDGVGCNVGSEIDRVSNRNNK